MASDSVEHESVRTILQVSAASLSFIASLTIITMILISPKKFTSSYRRIIFGMSFGDVVQSLAMLTGPFSVSNVHTCDWNGFAFACGTIMVPLYMFALSLRYFCKLKLKMQDEQFGRRIERWIHLVAIVLALSVCIMGSVRELYNPMPNKAFCFFEEYPQSCTKDPETYGECERGTDSYNYVLIVSFLLLFCLFGVTINMTMLCINSCWIQRTYSTRLNVTERNCAHDFLCCLPFYYNQFQDEGDADYVLRLYKMETIIQSSLYVGAFYLSYLPPVIQSILSMAGVKLPSIIVTIISFFYPLGGFFNVMIYARPKVVRIRHGIPDCSRLKAFFLVLKNGGEFPDFANDPNAAKLCSQNCEKDAEDGRAKTVILNNNIIELLGVTYSE